MFQSKHRLLKNNIDATQLIIFIVLFHDPKIRKKCLDGLKYNQNSIS